MIGTAWPPAFAGACPRRARGRCAGRKARGDMKAGIDEAHETPVAGRAVRMKRSPGGRHRVVKVLLTEQEHAGLAFRAAASGVSLQRYLIEAGMSGSVSDSAARRRAGGALTRSEE